MERALKDWDGTRRPVVDGAADLREGLSVRGTGHSNEGTDRC